MLEQRGFQLRVSSPSPEFRADDSALPVLPVGQPDI
jgi:hypothetical protein